MYLRIQIGLVALAATLSLAVPSALAQYKFESPDGHQTISPSQMPQQPSVNEIMSGAHGRTIPNNEPDIPGVPNFQSTTTGAGGNNETGMPQRIPNAQSQGANQAGNPIQQNNMQQKNAQNGQAGQNKTPQANATVPVNPASPGSIVLPQGESSTQRVGPIEPTPLWQRGILAFWLLLQFAAMLCVGVALTLMKNREIEEQGGHLIREDYEEPWSVIESTRRRPLENR